ncbi:MAG: type II secretion system protein [Rhodoferax sp.]
MKQHLMGRRRQAGFTFVELSFIVIIMGMIAIVLAQVVPAMRRSSATAETVRNLSNVELSLLSFAAIHGRLPCADTNDDGLENTSPSCAEVGKLPYRTLGYSSPLVNADGYDFKYGLYLRSSNVLRSTAELGSAIQRYKPTIGPKTPLPVTLDDLNYPNTNHRLDFCQGLRAGIANAGTPDNLYLYVQTRNSVTGALTGKKNVAYVLVDPGVGDMDLDGKLFDGLNATAGSAGEEPHFEHPNRQQSMTYDDRVVVGYFDQMWEALGCSANMATAGRAMPNVQTTLGLIVQASADYTEQLDIAKDMAFADQLNAAAGLTLAVTGLLSSGASIATDIASAINTFGVTSGASVAAGIAVGLSAAAVAVAGVNLGYGIANYNKFVDYVNDFETLKSTKLIPLYNSVEDDVKAGMNKVYSDQ